MKILCLCDSPTLSSGFARVAHNLFKRWERLGATVEVWGIAFMGWGYKEHPYVNQFFPAGRGGEWNTPNALMIFLQQLQIGEYTHVWIMQDTFLLSAGNFPQVLKDVCKEKGIRSMLYFPVDAALRPEWTDIIAAVDCPVAYTEYGKQDAMLKYEQRHGQLARAFKASKDKPLPDPGVFTPLNIAVLPHGVDPTVYRPISDRAAEREKFWQPVNDKLWIQPDDFLILNLNSHQRRKDVTRSMEILKELKRQGSRPS